MEIKDYRDETYTNELVDSYKSTLDEATRLAIISNFDPYFRKYANLFASHMSVDLTNKDTIKFLRLFMSIEDRATTTSLLRAARKTISYIRNIFKDYKAEEIYNETLCIFLEHLERYKPMIALNTPHKSRISFTHFIQVNVRFGLAGLVIKRQKDALHRPANLEYIDAMSPIRQPEARSNWNGIDLQWVRGDTASDLFLSLDELERYLIFLRYEEDEKPKSEWELARITGLDRMYVRRRFVKIRNKLAELIKC